MKSYKDKTVKSKIRDKKPIPSLYSPQTMRIVQLRKKEF